MSLHLPGNTIANECQSLRTDDKHRHNGRYTAYVGPVGTGRESQWAEGRVFLLVAFWADPLSLVAGKRPSLG